MNTYLRKFSMASMALSAAVLLVCGVLAILPGCKGNTTSAALPERVVTSPPTVIVSPATTDPRQGNPLTNPAWQGAQWWNFTAPANTTRTTQPTRAALLFDSDALYVAFISTKQSSPRLLSDVVSVFLDTTAAANGTEMVKISVTSQGRASCTWIRTPSPAVKREDGSPDFGHPISTIPDVPVTGLWAHVAEGVQAGDGEIGVWTAVVAIPLKALPMPLQVLPQPGAHWKFNLLRTVTGVGEQLQADLSPVYVGAQEFAPYRLADLYLEK